jgi:hypothetical protein
MSSPALSADEGRGRRSWRQLARFNLTGQISSPRLDCSKEPPDVIAADNYAPHFLLDFSAADATAETARR